MFVVQFPSKRLSKQLFLPNHSPMFSCVLRSHVTLFHPFRPNLPFQNINTLRSPQPFHHIPVSAPHPSYQSWMHYAWAILEPSQNLLGSHRTSLEASQIHLGTFTISITHQHLRRFQYYSFHFRSYYYSILALSLVA